MYEGQAYGEIAMDKSQASQDMSGPRYTGWI